MRDGEPCPDVRAGRPRIPPESARYRERDPVALAPGTLPMPAPRRSWMSNGTAPAYPKENPPAPPQLGPNDALARADATTPATVATPNVTPKDNATVFPAEKSLAF